MNILNPIILLLLIVVLVSIISDNNSMTIAVCVLLAIYFSPMRKYLSLVEQKGLNIGTIILTVSVLSSLVNSKFSLSTMLNSLSYWKSFLAVIIGIFVSLLGKRGILLISNQPYITSWLLIGIILGTVLFRGIPIGPIIAAGLLSLFLYEN